MMKKEFGHHKSQTSDDKYQWYRPEARTSQNPLRVAEGGDHASPPEHPKGKSGLDASAKVTRAELNKRSGDADLSKDKSCSKSSLEFRRSWYAKGHIMSGVISSVLTQRHLRNSPTKGDEGPSSGGTKPNSTFITAEVTFTKRKQPT
ncbi:hypothetical protein Tco_1443352 [Tanacetum coccineum]